MRLILVIFKKIQFYILSRLYTITSYDTLL